MPDSVRIKEIHAALGARDYAYFNNEEAPAVANLSWRVERIAQALGIDFNLAGGQNSVRQRKNVLYNEDNQVTVPSGWSRGQFSINTGDDASHDPSDQTRQNGGESGQQRLGIAYQQRTYKFANYDDEDETNNTIRYGDVVLCENIPQYLECLLEDFDKALNMREMGTGVLPRADGSGYCTFEGLGTLLAEVAYCVSALSEHIITGKVLALENQTVNRQILKGMGVPVGLGQLPIKIGKEDPQTGEPITAGYPVPLIENDVNTITDHLFDIRKSLAILLRTVTDLRIEDEEET